MATTVTIAISPGHPNATFGANPAMYAGDNAFWQNGDARPHWPYPAGQPHGTWLSFQIPASVPGQPKATSNQVSFDYAGSYPYQCALHPGESGTVVVSQGSRS